MRIGERVTYIDPEEGDFDGTVVKAGRLKDSLWVRLDNGTKVLAFPEDLTLSDRPVPGRMHPANVATMREAIVEAENAGRHSEANILRDSLPEVVDDTEPDAEAPPAGELRTLDALPARTTPVTRRPAPTADTDTDTCPKCHTSNGMRQEVIRGGFYAYRCMVRIGDPPLAGRPDQRPYCGGTWLGPEASTPSTESLR